MNIDIKAAVAAARHAYNKGVPEGGSVRLAQGDAIMKLDIGLCRKWREAIEGADPTLLDAPNNLRSFVLNYVFSEWLETLENRIVELYREQAVPLVSRPEVAVMIAGAVHEQVRRTLAREREAT